MGGSNSAIGSDCSQRAKQGTSVYNFCSLRSQEGIPVQCRFGCAMVVKAAGRAAAIRGDMRVRFAIAAAVMSLALSVAAQKEMHMVHAKGSFDIKMTPAEPTDFEKANDITRVSSEKTWHGDFEGVSHGEMITGSTASTGSMAYVAIERMTGKLNGRQGSFTFSHRATMMKGDAPSAGELSVTVLPNSGTEGKSLAKLWGAVAGSPMGLVRSQELLRYLSDEMNVDSFSRESLPFR